MNDFFKQDWLIIGNGLLLPTDRIRELMLGRKVVALDGAIVSCLQRAIIPNITLGDFDSLDKDIIDSTEKKHNIRFIFLPDQNTSDLDKAIRYIAEFDPKSIIISQAIGNRLDHSLHNLRLLKRLDHLVNNMLIFTETEKICYLKNKSVVICAENPEPVALVSFPKAVVSSKGLKYDMHEDTLEFAKRESTSNFLVNSSARITVNGEVLLIISHSTELVINNHDAGPHSRL